ncbi:hypothetical protein PG993_003119 [Apiospora rasikravindrae]|uniref:Heterokaryon incompatibility domain-containing protein n=1 Tax=Apiospora rasikravindrae TaxID=990691 RepID=A0ABR1TYL4_9PEZI
MPGSSLLNSDHFQETNHQPEAVQKSSILCSMAHPTSNFWRRCDLGAVLERRFGYDDQDDDPSVVHMSQEELDDLRRWKRGTNNMLRLQTLEKESAHAWVEFKSTLSQQQLLSWKLLTEWLNGAYHPKVLADAAQRAIYSGRPGQRREDGLSLHPEFPNDAMIDQCVYQHQLSELYAAELLDYFPDNEDEVYVEYFINLLEARRRSAFNFAVSQAISHASYLRWFGDPENGTRIEPSPEIQRPFHYPASLMEVCPWVTQTGTGEDGLPYYLWDTVGQCTIETSRLPDPKPTYTCISHTWGRWTTASTSKLDQVPWEIPGNSVFAVQRIPDILGTLRERICTRYVWLDLVCIPQTREGELGRIAEREIGRQAAIFRESAACLAWLNYIDDWDAENYLIEWMSCQFLRLTIDPRFYEHASSKHDAPWRESDKRPLQLTNHPFHVKYLGGDEFSDTPGGQVTRDKEVLSKALNKPSPWFSSLWTLQEACFCPHLTFVSRNLTPLLDASGKPISMERLLHWRRHFISLCTNPICAARSGRSAADWGIRLYNLMVENFFRSNSDVSPTGILIQGNARQCTGRRAEAIMSATGVLDWWDNPDVDKDSHLVLGMYPLAFVREAAKKFGPGFVLARKEIGAPRHSLRYLLGRERGSMMPFEKRDQARARGKRDVDMYPLKAQEAEWHPSFSHWEILESGSVLISRASILRKKAYGRIWTHVPAQVFISWRETPLIKRDATMVGLRDWLAEQSSMYYTYAIMVSKSIGMILQGLSTPGLGRRKLIKTGCFKVRGNASLPDADDWIESQDVSWVPERKVNWIVL